MIKCSNCGKDILAEWVYCGYCGVNTKQYEEANELIKRGLKFESKMEYTKAGDEYRKALTLCQHHNRIIELLGIESLLEEVTSKEQALIDSLEKGASFLSTHRWKEAIQSYKKALELNPQAQGVKSKISEAKKGLLRSHLRSGLWVTIFIVLVSGSFFGWWGYMRTPKQFAQKTLKQGVLSKDLLAKQAAIEALGELKDIRFLPFIKDALKDNNYIIRVTAVKALGEIRNSSVIPLLKESLFDKEWQVRYSAAQSLAVLGDTSGIQFLKQALK